MYIKDYIIKGGLEYYDFNCLMFDYKKNKEFIHLTVNKQERKLIKTLSKYQKEHFLNFEIKVRVSTKFNRYTESMTDFEILKLSTDNSILKHCDEGCYSIRYEVLFFTHYDKCIIRNNTHSHLIHDIFPAINFNLYDESIKMFCLRTSFLDKEIEKGYIHSHIPSHFDIKEKIVLKKFCLGSSEMYTALLMLTSSSFNQDEFLDDLSLVVAHMRPFVEWESLQGVPYIKMKTMRGFNKPLKSIVNALNEWQGILSSIFESELPFYYDYFSKIYKIDFDNPRFKKIVITRRKGTIKSKIQEGVCKELYGSYDENNNFISYENDTVSVPEEIFSTSEKEYGVFTFKNQDFVLKRMAEEGTINFDNIDISPSFKKFIDEYSKKFLQKKFKAVHQQRSQETNSLCES